MPVGRELVGRKDISSWVKENVHKSKLNFIFFINSLVNLVIFEFFFKFYHFIYRNSYKYDNYIKNNQVYTKILKKYKYN